VADSAVSARPLDMAIHVQSFLIPHFPSLMIAMSKPVYIAIQEYSPSKPVITFVPSRRQSVSFPSPWGGFSGVILCVAKVLMKLDSGTRQEAIVPLGNPANDELYVRHRSRQ
jgi:hypothetical protein